MTRNYEFASVIFTINTVYNYFHDFAKEYVTNKKSKEKITISLEEIEHWIKDHNVDSNNFSNEYIETLVVHSKLANALSLHNVFLFHGSSIYIDSVDNAYIFTARSGVGKSTHVRMLIKNYPNRIKYINDDKPLLSLENNDICVYGSPFNGKEGKSNNIKCKLKGIFILSRSKINSVKRITSMDGLATIANQLHIPLGIKERDNAFNFLFKLINSVPIYDLRVNLNVDAYKTSFKILEGDNK